MGKIVGLTFNEPEQTTETPVDASAICIEDMTVPQLKQFAKDNDIDIGSAAKKDDIIKAIIAAGDADAEV
jgi:hypothetical protein